MKLLIIADDVGNKLWPVTSKEVPKALLPIYSNHSQLHETLSRTVPVVTADGEDIFIVTTIDSLDYLVSTSIIKTFGIPSENIIAVPSSRGSALSISLACQYLLRSGKATKDDQVAFLTADQFFWPVSTFVFHYYNMVEDAKNHKKDLYMLGLPPSGVSSLLNYVSINWSEARPIVDKLSLEAELSTIAAKATDYHIKPVTNVASNLIEDNALWDLSNYVWNIGDTLDYVNKNISDVHRQVISSCFIVSSSGKVFIDMDDNEDVWNNMSIVQFNEDILPQIIQEERAQVVSMTHVIWTILDNWISIKHLLYDSNLYQPQQLPGVHLIDAQRNLIFKPPEKEIAVFGISDLIIIDTGDKLLVGTPGGIYEHF